MAFGSCYNLDGKLVIPESLTDIGDRAFINCHSLEEVEVAEDNTNYCDIDGSLYSKDGKTLIYFP